MTIALAIEYIPRRMKDLGFASEYFLRFRHLVLQAGEQINLDAHNQFLILVDEMTDINVSSDIGFYDLSNPNTNEQIYEHQGSVSITNYARNINHIRFIQVIPIN